MSPGRCIGPPGWIWSQGVTLQRLLAGKVYAGTDPLTGREIRFRKTCKTERVAQIELGKLLAMVRAGRQPGSDVTVAQLLAALGHVPEP